VRRIAVFALIAATGSEVSSPLLAQTTLITERNPDTAPVAARVSAYASAWASRDPERIARLHTPDTVFDLCVEGEAPSRGREAARERFAAIFRDNPSYTSKVRKVAFGPDFVVIEYDIGMNPPKPFTLGKFTYMPNGQPYAVPAIDVIRFGDGLVSEKVTFLDTDTIRANSRAVTEVSTTSRPSQ
jgi:uncharacterized protein (TIGR02246 family)